MTPEPLKDKQLGYDSYAYVEHSYQRDGDYFKHNDVKSAVAGCLEEIENIQSIRVLPETKDAIRKSFKKWFEDVI
jgi:hypothetical protein